MNSMFPQWKKSIEIAAHLFFWIIFWKVSFYPLKISFHLGYLLFYKPDDNIFSSVYFEFLSYGLLGLIRFTLFALLTGATIFVPTYFFSRFLRYSKIVSMAIAIVISCLQIIPAFTQIAGPH